MAKEAQRLERALLDFLGGDQFLDGGSVLLVIPPGAQAATAFDQERLGVTAAMTRGSLTVVALPPARLAALAPRPDGPHHRGLPDSADPGFGL